ncbi:MAG: gluconokinase [SAR324 cluster bacterium]
MTRSSADSGLPLSRADRAGCVLALDVGTSSTRCVAFDVHGTEIPLPSSGPAVREHAARATPDGGSELDAAPLLAEAFACLAAVSQELRGQGRPILGVGVCTLWHAVLAVDERGEPLTPLLLWNDMRSRAQALSLRRALDEAAVHRRTGCALHPSFLPARLKWLREVRPEVFRNAGRFVSFGEWLEFQLFGRWRVGLSMASGTGFLDQDTCAWDAEVLKAVGLNPERLSPLEPLHAGLRGLGRDAAVRLPALAETPFFPALGDGACNTVGSGACGHGQGALMVGTSAALRVMFPDNAPPAPPGLWRYLLDRRRALIGGALSNGGNLHAWLLRTLRIDEPRDVLERRLEAAQPGGHGLTMLPFLAGERNPDYPLDATGLVAGLRLASTPFDIFHAGLEAVAFRLAAIADRLRDAGCEPARYVASGGLLHSPAWARLLADVLGRPLTLSPLQQATARGAALVALEALGAVPSALAVPAPPGRLVEPDLHRHAAYAASRARHERVHALWRNASVL